MSCGTRCVAACQRCECPRACPLSGAEYSSPRRRSFSRRYPLSVAPLDFSAPRAPRPTWFPAAALQLAYAPAGEVLAWAVATFGADLTVATSMQDGVLVDLAVRADPGVEVVFLDTGFHFAETLETARRIQARYGLNLVTLRPDDGAPTYRTRGTDACCDARKVVPLDRHLAKRAAWVTGLR